MSRKLLPIEIVAINGICIPLEAKYDPMATRNPEVETVHMETYIRARQACYLHGLIAGYRACMEATGTAPTLTDDEIAARVWASMAAKAQPNAWWMGAWDKNPHRDDRGRRLVKRSPQPRLNLESAAIINGRTHVLQTPNYYCHYAVVMGRTRLHAATASVLTASCELMHD